MLWFRKDRARPPSKMKRMCGAEFSAMLSFLFAYNPSILAGQQKSFFNSLLKKKEIFFTSTCIFIYTLLLSALLISRFYW